MKFIINFYKKNHRYQEPRAPVDTNRSDNFFLYRFLSIGIGNRYSLMIDIDYYRLLSINYV